MFWCARDCAIKSWLLIRNDASGHELISGLSTRLSSLAPIATTSQRVLSCCRKPLELDVHLNSTLGNLFLFSRAHHPSGLLGPRLVPASSFDVPRTCRTWPPLRTCPIMHVRELSSYKILVYLHIPVPAPFRAHATMTPLGLATILGVPLSRILAPQTQPWADKYLSRLSAYSCANVQLSVKDQPVPISGPCHTSTFIHQSTMV